jgi:ribosomal protein S18 acetylase RimI-like enzyme
MKWIHSSETAREIDIHDENELSKQLSLSGLDRSNIIHAVNQYQVTIDGFIRDPDSIILQFKTSLLACSVREIAGRRLLVYGANSKDWIQHASILIANVENIARKKSCRLVQFAITPAESTWLEHFSQLGYKVRMYRLEKNLLQLQDSETQQTRLLRAITDKDSWLMDRGSEVEHQVRWLYPGTTLPYQDRMDVLLPEYAEAPDSIRDGSLRGLAVENHQSNAFCTWFENTNSNSALVSLLWVAPHLRQRGYASSLIRELMRNAQAAGMTTLRYVSSIHNTNVLALLAKHGFEIKNLLINKEII